MLPVFSQMASDLLDVLGEVVCLRETVSCRANIEHGVQLQGEHDDAYIERSVVTLSATHNARTGETILFKEGLFTLDVRIQASGYNERWVVVRTDD